MTVSWTSRSTMTRRATTRRTPTDASEEDDDSNNAPLYAGLGIVVVVLVAGGVLRDAAQRAADPHRAPTASRHAPAGPASGGVVAVGARAGGRGQPDDEPGAAAADRRGELVRRRRLRRDDAPWASSYALFFKLALIVIAIHVVFQALLSTQTQGLTVLFTLPEIPLPDGVGIKLGGEVTLEAVLNAVYFGLQLAAIFCCIGAANALGQRPAAAALHAGRPLRDRDRRGDRADLRTTAGHRRRTGAVGRQAARLRPRDPPVRSAGHADPRGRARTLRRPGRGDGCPRLRAYDERVTVGAAGHRRPGPARQLRAARRGLRAARPHTVSGPRCCWPVPRSASSGCGWAGGVPAGPATAPTRGRCPS